MTDAVYGEESKTIRQLKVVFDAFGRTQYELFVQGRQGDADFG